MSIRAVKARLSASHGCDRHSSSASSTVALRVLTPDESAACVAEVWATADAIGAAKDGTSPVAVGTTGVDDPLDADFSGLSDFLTRRFFFFGSSYAQ